MHVDPIVRFEPRENYIIASKLSLLICDKGSPHMMLCGSAVEDSVQCRAQSPFKTTSSLPSTPWGIIEKATTSFLVLLSRNKVLCRCLY